MIACATPCDTHHRNTANSARLLWMRSQVSKNEDLFSFLVQKLKRSSFSETKERIQSRRALLAVLRWCVSHGVAHAIIIRNQRANLQARNGVGVWLEYVSSQGQVRANKSYNPARRATRVVRRRGTRSGGHSSHVIFGARGTNDAVGAAVGAPQLQLLLPRPS